MTNAATKPGDESNAVRRAIGIIPGGVRAAHIGQHRPVILRQRLPAQGQGRQSRSTARRVDARTSLTLTYHTPAEAQVAGNNRQSLTSARRRPPARCVAGVVSANLTILLASRHRPEGSVARTAAGDP